MTGETITEIPLKAVFLSGELLGVNGVLTVYEEKQQYTCTFDWELSITGVGLEKHNEFVKRFKEREILDVSMINTSNSVIKGKVIAESVELNNYTSELCLKGTSELLVQEKE